MNNSQRLAIEKFVAKAASAQKALIVNMKILNGGAVQENWLTTLSIEGGQWEGTMECVLRCDSETAGVNISHGRPEEFELLRTVFAAGVTVPEPLWLCDDSSLIGRKFFLMRCIKGIASGHILVKDMTYAPDRVQLAERLGVELATIHAITRHTSRIDFLETYDDSPANHLIRQHRAYLDSHPQDHPVLEWAIRWLERHAPQTDLVTLIHGDFRTGNYMVDDQGLTGILDWEFAAWGDPLQDIGWFCAKCWRFGKVKSEAGGIGSRADFINGYERQSGRKIDKSLVAYWEVMAHVRWAVIALEQAERFRGAEAPSLLLALTGHMVPELEWEILKLTENN